MCDGECPRIISVFGDDVTGDRSVLQPEGDASPERGVRARPGVPDRDDPGYDGNVVDHEPAEPVDDAGHRCDTCDGLPVQPVRVSRAGSNDPRPTLGITQTLQQLIVGGDVKGDRPGLRICGQ